jgi:Arc-like DNA binding domain
MRFIMKTERHFYANIPTTLKEPLAKLARENNRSLAGEVTTAVKKYLRDNGSDAR